MDKNLLVMLLSEVGNVSACTTLKISASSPGAIKRFTSHYIKG